MSCNSRRLLSGLAAAAVLSACAPTGDSPPKDANSGAAKPASAAPTVNALLALERQANEAYSRGDWDFFEDILSDKLVMQSGGSRLGKADVVNMISGVKCDLEEAWAVTEPHMSRIDDDTYAFSYKATVEGTCKADGKTEKLPSPVRASTVWVRSGAGWQAVFHGENLIVDPAAAPAADAGDRPTKGDAVTATAPPAASPVADPITEALMAAESNAWEAWMTHDAGRIEALTADDMSFVNIFGTYLPDKAAAIKEWTSEACDVTRFTLTRGVGSSVSPTVAILTVTGSVEGTCGGEDIGGQEIYATTVYVRDGDAWKWAFGFNSPT